MTEMHYSYTNHLLISLSPILNANSLKRIVLKILIASTCRTKSPAGYYIKFAIGLWRWGSTIIFGFQMGGSTLKMCYLFTNLEFFTKGEGVGWFLPPSGSANDPANSCWNK
jgi:hypothetical protein